MGNDYFTFKNILAIISAPLTFILGMAGWQYKTIYAKVEDLGTTTHNLQVLVHEHSVHVEHLNDSMDRLEDKLDLILKKIGLL